MMETCGVSGHDFDCLCDVHVSEPTPINFGLGKGGILFSETVARTIDPNENLLDHIEAVMDLFDRVSPRLAEAKAILEREEGIEAGYVFTSSKEWVPTEAELKILRKDIPNSTAAFLLTKNRSTVRRWRKHHGVTITQGNGFQQKGYRYRGPDDKYLGLIKDTSLTTTEVAKRTGLSRSSVGRRRQALGVRSVPRRFESWDDPATIERLRSDRTHRQVASDLGASLKGVYRHRNLLAAELGLAPWWEVPKRNPRQPKAYTATAEELLRSDKPARVVAKELGVNVKIVLKRRKELNAS